MAFEVGMAEAEFIEANKKEILKKCSKVMQRAHWYISEAYHPGVYQIN